MLRVKNRYRSRVIAGLIPFTLALLLAAATDAAGDWPHCAGRAGTHLEEPSGWKDGRWVDEKPVWEAEVGEGSTSPLVAGGRLFVMGWKDGQDRVHCLDAATGKAIWSVPLNARATPRHATGDENAYAGPTSTPEYDADTGFLYTLSCDGDLNCWDAGAGGKRVSGAKPVRPLRRPPAPGQRPGARRPARTATPPPRSSTATGSSSKSARTKAPSWPSTRTGRRRWASESCRPAGHTGGLAPMIVEGVPCLAVVTYDELLVLRLTPATKARPSRPTRGNRRGRTTSSRRPSTATAC